MRKTLLAIAIVISGLSGPLHASSKHRHPLPSAATVHKVRRGESAARIAKDHGLSVAELGALNPRVSLARLAPGTVLKVGASRRSAGDPPPPIRFTPPPQGAEPASEPATAEAAAVPPGAPAGAVAPLPGTPAIGPASLVHLERILPFDLRSVPPEAGKETSQRVGPAASASLTLLRKVLPEDTDEDDSALEVEALTDPSGFELADRDNLDLLWPVETRTVSSAWGPRMRTRVVRKAANHKRVIRRFLGSHRGVDLSAPMGTDIFAALEGKVVASGRHKDYGNFVAIDHGNGVMTLYAHCSRNFVEDGQVVRRGQKIAEVGRTGNATGPHLHFELRLDGLPQNPLPKLNDAEEIPADLVAQNQVATAPSAGR